MSRRFALLLFIGVFVIPVAWSIVFYSMVATDRYVSEARFIVRGVNSQQIGGLSVLLRTFGIARSNDDSYAIHDYMASRDALNDLQKTIDIRAVFSIPEADYLTRFGTLLTGDSEEALYQYYLRRVKVLEDIESGITTLTVSAYSPEEARAIATRLLELSEERVNDMNTRARQDALRFAQQTLEEAGDELVRSQVELTRFRNAELLINPELAAAGNFEVITSLSQELVQHQVRLQQMVTASPSNPNISSMRERVRSLEQQITLERAKLAGADDAIATKLGQYEELFQRRAIADKAYEVAVNSLDQARQEAARKQIYLESVVRPNHPDESTEPQRGRSILTVSLLCLTVFVMLYMLVVGSREHLNAER